MNSFIPLLVSILVLIAVKLICRYAKLDFGISFFTFWLTAAFGYYLIEIFANFDNPLLRFWICQYGGALAFAALMSPFPNASSKEVSMAILIFSRILIVGFLVLCASIFGCLVYAFSELFAIFGTTQVGIFGYQFNLWSMVGGGVVTVLLSIWLIYASVRAAQDAKNSN